MKKSILILMAMAGIVAFAQTQQQAEAGRALYSARCATCHGVDLGGGEGPQLSGANFMASWGTRSSKELITYIQASMPPGTNKLGEQDALNAASFVLAANGVAPGTEALAATTSFVIRARGNGKPAIPLAAGGQVAAAGAGPHGITIAGTVKNYTPVTGAMLRNPSPADWLMIRRTYSASNFSPLNQVNTGNVKDLQLVWSWSMSDYGANEPTPMVHDGIMFLANTGNIVQALDAKTGELIWENRIGPEQSGGLGAIRNLGLWGDKVYIGTTDSNLVALEAKTGKIAWETRIADPKKGYSNTSGPLIIDGIVIQGMGGCDRYKETGCYISAYDAETGKQLWKFETVARVGTKEGETWGSLPNLLRAGGDTWITGSYDPTLDMTYWGVAQAKPWMRAIRGTNAAALYTTSTLALK